MNNTQDRPSATVVACDPEALSSIPPGGFFRVVAPDAARPEHSQNVFVLAAASCLREVGDLVTATNHRHQLRALFVRTDLDPRLLPQIFQYAGLRTMRNAIAHYGHEIPLRVLRAWQIGAQDDLIADATVIGDSLHVVSCEPRSYRIPFSAVVPLKDIPSGERGDFRLASDGSYIHWPARDVHMDLASLLTVIDARRRVERVKHAYGQSYGEAIAHLRRTHTLRQTDIPGLSEREVRRIESAGEVSHESLKRLAAAHGLELSAYLDRLANVAREYGSVLAEDPERVTDTGT